MLSLTKQCTADTNIHVQIILDELHFWPNRPQRRGESYNLLVLREVNLAMNRAEALSGAARRDPRRLESANKETRLIIPAELTDVDLVRKPRQRLPQETQQDKGRRCGAMQHFCFVFFLSPPQERSEINSWSRCDRGRGREGGEP